MMTPYSGRRRPGAAPRLAGLLLTASLSVLGCSTSADAAPDGAREAAAADPVEISSFSNATFTALVADRAGALHAVWLDRNPETQRQAVYHRSSADGGRSWGRPTFLSEGQPDGYTGIPGAVADGAGRVYVVWKLVDRGTSMAEEELRSTPAFGTLVYRVLENGRWSAVRAIGAERGVVAWFAAADPQGRVHVVWSENPDGTGFLNTTADAGTVRQAQLDGATPRGGRVVSGASGYGKLGYWSLSGWVDGNGAAHWIAVRGSDAERRIVLVHSNGGRERMLPFFNPDASSRTAQSPPQLVRDASGQERVVMYEGGSRSRIVDYPVVAERAPVVLATFEEEEAIRDFQLSTAGGQIVATMQITGTDGNRLADLYVTTLRGDSWTRPVQLTDNVRAQRAQGVTDGARSVGTVKVMSAIHASVVPARSGALQVLLTNRETSRHVDTRAGGMSGASARSRAWFMTVPGVAGTVAGADNRRAPVPAQSEPTPTPVARERPTAGMTSAAVAEQLFARYDETEDGWLSGTELQSCQCGAADVDRDGEVTKAEFVAAVSRGGGNTPSSAGINSRSDLTREAERLFARYDITEGGWLSGTELNACGCRSDDANGDGEVTKAEFVAGFLRRGGASATPARTERSNPAPAPSPRRAEPSAPAGAGLPVGKYNCYAFGAGRPMPWEPGFGGAAETPRSTTQYIMNLTIGAGGTYQYLNRGRGTYEMEPGTGTIDWRSGPMAGSGIRAAYARRADGRPIIYLSLEGTRAHCVGPQQ